MLANHQSLCLWWNNNSMRWDLNSTRTSTNWHCSINIILLPALVPNVESLLLMGWCVLVDLFPCSDFPIRGMQIYDGPINVQNCTFRKYTALDGRHTSAFGFRLNNSWQSCPNNNVTDITFDHVPVSQFFSEIHKTSGLIQSVTLRNVANFHSVGGNIIVKRNKQKNMKP